MTGVTGILENLQLNITIIKMALPKNTEIPRGSSQFAKLQDGANKFRILSDIVVGWEGWKDNKPFRHEGSVCNIKPEQVDLNQNEKPNINYFWAMVVWNYKEEKIQVLELTQKTIMGPLKDMEDNEDWGDLKKYDIQINKSKVDGKVTYSVLGIPPKPLSTGIKQKYEESDVDVSKLFDGKYPMEEVEDKDEIPF